VDGTENLTAATFAVPITPPSGLEALARSQLEHAVDGARRGLKVYESLRSLNDVIGTQYGDRVLYELLQNAHDAHDKNAFDGEVAIHLIVHTESEGELRVANKGRGFSFSNLDAIRNIGTSNKEIGESIGNKGLGFRSVEAITDDVHVFSQYNAKPADHFDGYCFRFATLREILDRLIEIEAEPSIREQVARTIPRYLIPLSPGSQPEDVRDYARRGYATVVSLPLRTPEAVDLARKQVADLDRNEAPLMLFLRRLKAIEIKISEPRSLGRGFERTLDRVSSQVATVPSLGDCVIEKVDLGKAGRFLVVRRTIDKAATLEAVERSVSQAPQLTRWLEWSGEPEISVAVADGGAPIRTPRYYNFLAMDDTATAPLAGFVDAPFFTDIDRRNLKAALPLNDHLIAMVADTCAGVAIACIGGVAPLPSSAVIDLLAWTPAAATKIAGALLARNETLRGSALWPTHDGATEPWTSLASAVDWPEIKNRFMSPERVAGVGASILPINLGAARLIRIRNIAASFNCSLKPQAQRLATWAAGIAQQLHQAPRTRPTDWVKFYSELISVFAHFKIPLWELRGHKIIWGAQGILLEATAMSTPQAEPVYVRTGGVRRRLKSSGPPLPPSSLSRKLRFLSDEVVLPEPTVQEFRNAGLLRIYDPVEVLTNLETTLGRSPTEIRRRDALIWAFRVWKIGAAGIEEALKAAKLQVPTLGGWQPATNSSFSAAWTPAGQMLEAYLTEGALVSKDCEAAHKQLLVPWGEWPSIGAAPVLPDWRRFLERLGVEDGMRPVGASIRRHGSWQYHWETFFQRGASAEGFGPAWITQVKPIELMFPQTDYRMAGEAWRIPGQLEHAALGDTAKTHLCDLIIAYLRDVGDRDFNFLIGAYHKQRDQDPTRLPTPLQVFLRTGAWLAVHQGEDLVFRAPHQCWASRVGRPPPRLVDRYTPESSAGTPPILFDRRIGLRDWSEIASAPARLTSLAWAVGSLSSSDRRDFRDHYRRAWSDVTESGHALEAETIIVERAGALQPLSGEPEAPATVYVTREPHAFAARTLNDRNEPVLDIGEANLATAMKLLRDTGRYIPISADGGGVRLKVDGTMFAPSTDSPLLIATPGLEWLPDAVILAFQNLGDPLELRNVSAQTIERRVRAIRLHRCRTISLLIGEKEVVASGGDRIQAYPHSDRPTLIVAGDDPFGWRLLIQAAPELTKLLGTGVKSLELLLLRLNQNVVGDQLLQPTHESLAKALGRTDDVVREHFAAVDGSVARKVRAVISVVHYVGGDALAAQLQQEAERRGPRLDLIAWLDEHCPDLTGADIVRACTESQDPADVRRRLDLDFGRFNRSLIALGMPGLPFSSARLSRPGERPYASILSPASNATTVSRPEPSMPTLMRSHALTSGAKP